MMLPIDADIITSDEKGGIERFCDRLADPISGRRFGVRRGVLLSRCLVTLDAHRAQQEFLAAVAARIGSEVAT